MAKKDITQLDRILFQLDTQSSSLKEENSEDDPIVRDPGLYFVCMGIILHLWPHHPHAADTADALCRFLLHVKDHY